MSVNKNQKRTVVSAYGAGAALTAMLTARTMRVENIVMMEIGSSRAFGRLDMWLMMRSVGIPLEII